MMGHFRNLSLTRQILYLILMMLIILLISFVISNMVAKRIVESKVTDSAGKILLQVQDKTESFYADMERISVSMLYSPTVQTYLDLDNYLSRILMNHEVISVFSNTTTLKENIRGIQLYNRAGTMVASLGLGTGESVKLPDPKIEYSGLLKDPDTGELIPYYSISVPIYNLKNTPTRDYKGTSVFVMDVGNFSNILQNAKITANSRLLLLDQNKKMLASVGNTPNIDTFRLEEWKNDNRYIVQTSTLSETGWELISIIPKNELLQELNIVQRLNVATYAVMFCILGLFLILFFTRILRPVKALMDFMKSYPKTGRESRFPVVYHNEIGVLAANLNKMLDEIDSLSKEIQLTQKQKYEIEITKNQMEISAFRNQINPHFLYNTLECISAMSIFYKAQDIGEISASLSNMFRYSVKGGDFSTIQDEISHIKEYAKIIEYRFMGKIRVVVDADERLLKQKTIKMLLQPMVENAVFHGLEMKIDSGIVRVEVKMTEQNQVQYIVQDNGNGMEEAQLKELVARLRQFESQGWTAREATKGIGLPNIYRRIKLLYGNKAEMSFYSKRGTGTTVTITFPVQDHVEQLEVE
ncbi:cache domain-containing sensor histidine kinase [Paenibacillus prosopidis]|uniref:histidine kinase n=1 Tax=Paenibacillus prosopidis TaxID=630520 RepID=A0A368W4A8_9BACL|nr:sensor histidine kinase [Paenibacillus prosopidis]RCW49663.1 two-component system sensor histidine kinase YesM [Paenibacillus prosopidis]